MNGPFLNIGGKCRRFIKHIQKGLSCLLAACLLLATPGAQAYQTAGQIIAANIQEAKDHNWIPSPITEAFLYFLKLQKIPSLTQFQSLPLEQRQRLWNAFKALESELLMILRRQPLPPSSQPLITPTGSLTLIGFQTSLQLKSSPSALPHAPSLPTDQRLSQDLINRPIKSQQQLSHLIEKAPHRAAPDLGLTLNALSGKGPRQVGLEQPAKGGLSQPQVRRARYEKTSHSAFTSQNSKGLLPNSPFILGRVLGNSRGQAQFRSAPGAAPMAAGNKLARQFDASKLLDNHYAVAWKKGNRGEPAQTWESLADFQKDAARLHYYVKDGSEWKEIQDPSQVPAIEAVGIPVTAFLGAKDDPDALEVKFGRKAAKENWSRASGALDRRLQKAAFYEPLSDDSYLKKELTGNNSERQLAGELAALETLSDALSGDPDGADPVLRDETKAAEKAAEKVQELMTSYYQATRHETDMRQIYAHVQEMARSDKALSNLAKANTNVVTTLLLKRGYMFLDFALTRLREMQGEVHKQQDRNKKDQEELTNEKAIALEKLKIAQDLYNRALAGEFTKKVDEDIKKIEDTLAKIQQDINSAVKIKNLLNGGWGNLAGTFIDPAVVNEEIATWNDLRNQFSQAHDKAFRFLDPMRQHPGRIPDEFGDQHYESVHLWTEEMIAQLQQAESAMRLSTDEFKQIHKIRECLKTNPDCFYIGVQGDPSLQAAPEQKEQLLQRREGFSLLTFAEAIIKFKIAESTLNAVRLVYAKDPAQGMIPLQEPYYQSTLSRLLEAAQLAQALRAKAKEGFNMERKFLVDDLKVMAPGDFDKLVNMIDQQFQTDSKEGFVHYAFDVANSALETANKSLEFYQWKKNLLNSCGNLNFFQCVLKSNLTEKQKEISHQQLELAVDKLLPFLKNWMRPQEAGRTYTYEGFVNLYKDGYGQLYNAAGALYDTEAKGFETFDQFLQNLITPFEKEMENVKRWLNTLNPKEDPAMRRLGRTLADSGDELLRQLRNKKFMIYAAEETQKQREKLKAALEELKIRRGRLTEIVERSSPEDPNYAKAREMVLEGELLYSPEGLDVPTEVNQKSGPLFIRKNTVERIMAQGAVTGGRPPTVKDWIGSLGLDNYDLLPVGSGADSFYVVTHFAAGTGVGSADQLAGTYTHDALLKFGNLGQILGHNMSLSLYDWKDLESPPRGHRGARVTFERDKDDEKIINNTVIDIHQNLQQGGVFRAMIFENMAFTVLGDRLFIGLTGFGDFPLNQGPAFPHLQGGDYTGWKEDFPPYTLGGRAKAVVYLHEVVSLNAEILDVFAKDPYDFTRTINTEIDPLTMKPEEIHLQGAILNYLKRHGGIEIDFAKIFNNKNTFALEFFLEDENLTEKNPGAVSENYKAEVMDNYNKFWKGARLIKEIRFNMFGEPTTLMGELRGAFDQNWEFETSGRVSMYLPRGITVEGKGAKYGDKYTGKGSLALSIGSGSEIFASYGNDRIESIPKLMLGVKSTITVEQLRKAARNSAEIALKGGDTLEDFRDEIDNVFGQSQESKPGEIITLKTALGRTLANNANLSAIRQRIGVQEEQAVELQRVLIGGLAAQAGVVLGTGYKDPQNQSPTNAYGYGSTAGGIQVGAQMFFGLKKAQKEKALREIARIKVLLYDLRKAYEEAAQEFRAAAIRVVLARLDVKKMDQILSRPDINENPTLKARADLEAMRLRAALAQAEALLRLRIGLDSKAPLPSDLEKIPIDPDHPEKTLAAATKALAYPDGWKKLLESISGVDPKKTALPGIPETLIANLLPLHLLPWVDEVVFDVGANFWDLYGNTFGGLGANVKLTFYNREKGRLEQAAILEGRMADLAAAEKLLAQQAREHAGTAQFDQWALERQQKVIETYLSHLKDSLDAAEDLARRLKILDQISEANRELGRINLELLSVTHVTPAKAGVQPSANLDSRLRGNDGPGQLQKYAVQDLTKTVQDAEKESKILAQLSVQRQVSQELGEAARSRVSVGVRLGARWNPVSNLYFISNTDFFSVDGWSFLLPQLEIAIKSSARSQIEEKEALALAEATVADQDLQRLDLRRQIAEIYLRLLYADSIKKELLDKIASSEDPAEIARWNVEILEIRKAISHDSVRLLVLLGKDPSKYELDLSALTKKNPEQETEKLRPWIEANLSRAQKLERRALETRLEVVRALEGKLHLKDRVMNIRSEPVSALFQVVGDIVASLFGEDNGPTSSFVDLENVHRYHLYLKKQLHDWEKTSQIDKSRSGVKLDQREREFSRDRSLSNRLSRELAWAASVAEGYQGRKSHEDFPDAVSRRRAPLLKWGARVYLTQEADPTPSTAKSCQDNPANCKLFYDPSTKRSAVFYEGMIHIILNRPEMINPRLLAKAEELELARETRLEKMESDLKQARLSGLLWKNKYLTGKLADTQDPDLRQRLEKRIQENQETIKSEFNLTPDQYPQPPPSPTPLDPTDANILVQTALKFVVGDAPILGPLASDLALGRLQNQAIVDNLRYQSMSPSFVLGYLREGFQGGVLLSAPTAGRIPGAEIFQDISRVMDANTASVLKANSLAAETRERLVRHHYEFLYLQEELVQREVLLARLKEELDKDSGSADLIDRYHLAFEETLEATARLHDLHIQIETDLRLIGIDFPKSLGRSSRDPWSMERRLHALGAGEALALAREMNPTAVAGWSSLAPKDKTQRLKEWKASLAAKIASLNDKAKERIKNLAQNIRKDSSLRPRRDNRAAGFLTSLDENGRAAVQDHRAISIDEINELRAQGRILAYDAASGERADPLGQAISPAPPRLLVIPVGYKGEPPLTITDAAGAGFMEFHPGQSELAKSAKEAASRLEEQERLAQLHDQYRKGSDSFAVAPVKPQSALGQRVLMENEALELTEQGNLSLLRVSTNKKMKASVLKDRTFWKKDALQIYFEGDYQFQDEKGRRVWTVEELEREGRLLAFEEIPLNGRLVRIDPAALHDPKSSAKKLRLFGYFGKTPELLSSVRTDEDLEELATEIQEIAPTALGQERLRRETRKQWQRASQSAYVYLKTAHGFLLDKEGRLSKVLLTENEMGAAKDKESQSNLYLSQDMTLILDQEGNLIEVLMRALDGTEKRETFIGAGKEASRWEKEWAAVEVDSAFRVKKIWKKGDLENGVRPEWSYFMEDRKLHSIADNRFPGGADAGLARSLAVVNSKAETTVLFSGGQLEKRLGDDKGRLLRSQIRPWILTASFAAEVALGFVYSPWALPLVIGVSGTNTAETISAITGEGHMEQTWGFGLDLAWDIANMALKKVIPQPKDKIYDPSGYPQLVMLDPASGWDLALYYVFSATLAGRNSDRLLEVDPKNKQPTHHVVKPGVAALKRSVAYHEEDFEAVRGKILGWFNGGLELTETMIKPGAFGEWKDTHVYALPKGKAYDQALAALARTGVKIAPDGKFEMEIMPMGNRVSGQLIKGIPGARSEAAAAQRQLREGEIWEKIFSESGGAVTTLFSNGRPSQKTVEEGTEALVKWKDEVQASLKNGSALYDTETQTFVDSKGTWLFNPRTLALVFFNSEGKTTKVIQAYRNDSWSQELSEKELQRLEFAKAYPRLIQTGAVLHADSEGRITSFEEGQEATDYYLEAQGEILSSEEMAQAVQQGYTFPREDGGQDLILFPLEKLKEQELVLRQRAEQLGAFD